MTYAQILNFISDELGRAESLHPDWPTDAVHAAAIMAEEAGEVVKAAIDYHYGDGTMTKLYDEAIQTAAMCYRILMSEYKRGERINGGGGV